jgi:drug/metabolite transporter (DMT)-like permease
LTSRGWLLFIAMGVIWGIPYLLIKVAVAELTPASLMLLRTGVGAVLLVPVALISGRFWSALPHWKWIAALSVIQTALPWVLLNDAERRLPSSLAGLLVAAVPLTAAAFGAAAGFERLDARRVVGLVIGFAGVAVLLGLDVSLSDLRAAGELGLVVVGYALGPLIVTRYLSGVSSVAVAATSVALCALAFVPLGIAQMPPGLPSTRVLAAVLVLGVVCTALAFVLFYALIAEAGPIRANFIAYLNPAVAVLLGVVILREPLTLGIGLGFVLIVFGLWLATRRFGGT